MLGFESRMMSGVGVNGFPGGGSRQGFGLWERKGGGGNLFFWVVQSFVCVVVAPTVERVALSTALA